MSFDEGAGLDIDQVTGGGGGGFVVLSRVVVEPV
jgi:hypothetical protein